MQNLRTRRVGEQIQKEICALLQKEIKDPRIGFVTITEVKVSKDLRWAKVYFTTTGEYEDRVRSLAGFQSSAGFIRKTLGKRLHLRTIPEFLFKYDTSLDEAQHIEQLLTKVHNQNSHHNFCGIRGSAKEVAHKLVSSHSFLLTSHLNPDGDAIASILAMGHILHSIGKEVVMYNPDPIPYNFRFLPWADKIKRATPRGPFDVTLILDCCELDRIGPLPAKDKRGEIVNIDHHLTAHPIGKIYYLDSDASSVGEMIFRIFSYLHAELSLDAAMCIYTSILSDTGSFRYSNTSAEALHIAAQMVTAGVSPWEVALCVYETQPASRLNLLARVLQTLKISRDGKYASILVTQKVLKETTTTKDVLDGFINYPRSIDGVEVAIQFYEQKPNSYKISFRSRGHVNVATIAECFAGGGHVNAAGCEIVGEFEEVQTVIYQAVEQALR